MNGEIGEGRSELSEGLDSWGIFTEKEIGHLSLVVVHARLLGYPLNEDETYNVNTMIPYRRSFYRSHTSPTHPSK
jgi:hypothetical protein